MNEQHETNDINVNENEGDFVIKELDVYLSKSLINNLYLFQYPVRPAKMNYDNATYHAARIKPKNKKVELEIKLDTKNPNYSTTKGEQFAMNVDNSHTQEQKYYNSNVMDKQLLVSTNAATGNMNKHYCVGVVKSNQLHLTPLQNLIQLKPSFEYFDIYEKKVKDAKEQFVETDHSTEDEDAEVDKTELITVRYAKEAAKTAPQEVEENWINIDFVNNDRNNRSVLESHKNLFCKDYTDVDVDGLNSDYSSLLLNFNNETAPEN